MDCPGTTAEGASGKIRGAGGVKAGGQMPDSGAASGSPVGGGKLLARGVDTFLKELGAAAKTRPGRSKKSQAHWTMAAPLPINRSWLLSLMRNPEPEELEIEDPTPMMEVWRKDADEFGIPFEVQKGLIFLTAFGLHASYQAGSLKDWIGFTKKLSKKIRLTPPHIPDGEGGHFYDKLYSPLLTELCERFMGENFTSQLAFTGRGKPFSVWNRGDVEGRDLLPACLSKEMWRMADWDEVMTSLCAQIGDGIHMNLEGAYLAGFLYFDSVISCERSTTMQIAQLVSGMLPPKFMWFRHMMNIKSEMAGQGNPMAKILDCFLAGIPSEAPLLYRMVTFLSDQLHYEAPGKRRQSIWDASLIQFTSLVSCQRNWFSSNAVAYWADFGALPPEGYVSDHQSLPSLIEYLQEKEWIPPVHCSSIEEAVGTVAVQIEARWGYRILDDSDDLTPADNWTRRACVLHVCTVNSILHSGWNAFDEISP